MTRSLRILAAVGALVLVVVASALAAPSDRARDRMSPVAASHQPSPGTQGETADEGGTPSAELLDRLATLLGTDAGTIETLAADYGVGGAVRLLAWSQESGVPVGDLAAMFDSGMGWGEIALQLNEANGSSLRPGVGSTLGNGGGQGVGAAAGAGQGIGAGRANAPGQQRQGE